MWMPDRNDVIAEIMEHIESTLAVDSEYVNIPLDLLQYALSLLKEQDERIKMLEHQLETITKWRANAGAFD